ncbi:NAD(P)-binding protein [Piedraia hortae CBS 480.64]|uniref:NAD(P)-binding protein n=1 Tax=Piedraia hortae CBS 480.64 TaxID=1314780 RepID=A0A6A7CA50_9PEZI|nr:NAD(P)-binding protein [Piedraia hortae CBS 480.64]
MATTNQVWYHNITLDLLVQICQRSVFHPFIAWLVPLCQRAVGASYTSFEVRLTCAYAAAVTLAWILGSVNQRIAYGAPRQPVPGDDVVVITGGANGLGKILADMYGMRGASVAVLDVQEPEERSEASKDVKYYLCDVGDAAAVTQAKEKIETDLGIPTILINNAGIVSGKALLDLTDGEIERTIRVNLLSHFHTIRAFLPGILKSECGGTVVTIASVLGKLGAARLSDYTAAKAGLIAMHTSLKAELESPVAPKEAERVRLILVTPGQMTTRLFCGVQTPSNFFGPVVEPVELANEIVRMTEAGKGGEISLPFYAQHIAWFHVLPVGLQILVRKVGGVDRAMEEFGRPNSIMGSR